MNVLRKPIWILVGLAALAALAMLARDHIRTMPAGEPAPAPGASLTPDRVVAEGMVVAYPGALVRVGAEADGRIVHLDVQEGSFVKEGEKLGEIFCDDLRALLGEAEAKLTEATVDGAFHETESKRLSEMVKAKAAPELDLLRSQRNLAAAKARILIARANVALLEARIRKHVILAPLSGTVIARTVHPGETVSIGTELLTIADLGRLRIQAEVDEFDIARVATNDEVEVTVEGIEGKSWPGRIEEIPDMVSSRRLRPQDPGRPVDVRVLLVKVALVKPVPFKVGQRVQVAIRHSSQEAQP